MQSPELVIAGRKIGPDYPPYIIAELSANHNGKLSKALELIEAAAATGADAIKIQTYTADTMTIPHDGEEFLIKGGLWDGYQLHQLYQEAYTPYEWHAQMFAKARELGITIFSTPFDETAVDLLAGLDAPAYKIASFEVIDLPLIKYVAKQGKPMIISTGMANLGEIQEAVETAQQQRRRRHRPAALHQRLPCADRRGQCAHGGASRPGFQRRVRPFRSCAGICRMRRFDSCSAAPSSKSILRSRAPTVAQTLAFSLEPDEFKRLVDDCKSAWSALGSVGYSLAESETRQHAVSTIDLRSQADQGRAASDEREYPRHPARIWPAAESICPTIIGRTAARDIAYGEALKWSAIA